jgi:hypothetical protein
MPSEETILKAEAVAAYGVQEPLPAFNALVFPDERKAVIDACRNGSLMPEPTVGAADAQETYENRELCRGISAARERARGAKAGSFASTRPVRATMRS